jgi:hypothetical protein
LTSRPPMVVVNSLASGCMLNPSIYPRWLGTEN